MAFTGYIEAPKIVPSAFGLLSVAQPDTSLEEDKWIRGFAQGWETTVKNLSNYDDTDATASNLVSGATINPYDNIKPFFIEVDETISTLGFLGIDRIARIKRKLEGVTQRAMEQELWDGAVRKGATHENLALSDTAATDLLAGAAVSAKRAIAALEYHIGDVSHAGEQGVIHMTRDIFSLLSADGQDFERIDGVDYLQTLAGTPVIIGSGYSGTGPDGSTGATATDSNKWMYATGTVKTYLGDVDVVNDNLSQAYNVSGNQNDMRLKAIRPAAVYFDPSIHLAVRVDLTA